MLAISFLKSLKSLKSQGHQNQHHRVFAKNQLLCLPRTLQRFRSSQPSTPTAPMDCLGKRKSTPPETWLRWKERNETICCQSHPVLTNLSVDGRGTFLEASPWCPGQSKVWRGVWTLSNSQLTSTLHILRAANLLRDFYLCNETLLWK